MNQAMSEKLLRNGYQPAFDSALKILLARLTKTVSMMESGIEEKMMSITLYPTLIKAMDETGETMFYLEAFDSNTCYLRMSGLIGLRNLDEVLNAIKLGVTMLQLDNISGKINYE